MYKMLQIRRENTDKYIQQVAKTARFKSTRSRTIFDGLLAKYEGKYYYDEERKMDFNQLLWGEKREELASIFTDDVEYQVLVTLLGQEWAQKFKQIWDRSTNYIYSTNSYRRSYRTQREQSLYLPGAVAKLLEMLTLVANDFSYEVYFSSQDNRFSSIGVIADLLALELDEGNQQVLDWVQEVVYGENNTALINREIIKGMLMSRNSIAHKWVGKLLLAAQLQEGLRQSIVESIDESSREGFLYILKIIMEHNLLRFSSVVRALDVWTGLGFSAQKPAVVKKSLETVQRCLTKPDYIQECLLSDDGLLIYLGLWAVAFDEVMATEVEIQRLLASAERYKRVIALVFLHQIQYPTYQHWIAVPLLDDPDFEVKCWALGNIFSGKTYYSLRPAHQEGLLEYYQVEGIGTPEEIFYKLKDLYQQMPKKKVTFKQTTSPGWEITVTYDTILTKMLLAIARDQPTNLVDLMLDYRTKMSADTRYELIHSLIGTTPQSNLQKQAVVEALGDRSSYIRSEAVKAVQQMELGDEEYQLMEGMLRYKAGDLRKNIIGLLLKQTPAALLVSVKRLLADKDEQKILAALDMIATIDKEEELAEIAPECRELAAKFSESASDALTQKTIDLAEKIINDDQTEFSRANGFQLYDPDRKLTLAEITYPKRFSSKKLLSTSPREIRKILTGFSDLIEQYREYEYEAKSWGGSTEKVLLGSLRNLRPLAQTDDRTAGSKLDNYPLSEVWREAAQTYKLTTPLLIEILFYYHLESRNRYGQSSTHDWYDQLMEKIYPTKHERKFSEFIPQLSYSRHIYTIFQGLLADREKEEIFEISHNVLSYIYCTVPTHRLAEEWEQRDTSRRYYPPNYRQCLVDCDVFKFWFDHLRSNFYDDDSFKQHFELSYAFYQGTGYLDHTSLQLIDFEIAFNQQWIDEMELYQELCGRPLSHQNLQTLTNTNTYNSKLIDACPKLQEVTRKVAERIVSIELKRGDLPTEVSQLAANIYKCSGTRFFVDILIGSEKETYVRGYNYVQGNSTRKEIFSHLLTHCFPAEGEDATTLATLLKERPVTDKQLIDAAMYSPQWLEIVEEYLNWPGLRSAGWYFHAHINEAFSNHKATIVARYSPLSPLEFKNGAFDINWFNEAYTTLGEERFQIVYDSAKYIAGGGLHKRAQLFVDAVLGRIELWQAEQIISEKRNKDYVRCYGLIPLERGKSEMLHRYEFLHRFLKESKKFGAQRRESEGKAVEVALENLARNAGFADVTRFTWYMETEKIRSIQQFLEPATIEGYEIQIAIDELGKSTIGVAKDGKTRKTIPAKLKKTDYVKEMKAVHKALKDQHSRARVTLERAMEAGEAFTVDELQSLSHNPVIYPLIQHLVFVSGDHFGYFQENGLVAPSGGKLDLQPEDQCIIAHPVHFYQHGVWTEYQKDLFDRQLVQPFKQVFREMYRPNQDELAAVTRSTRYAGHQIQPRKAAALLKGRGWTASYYEGLQKIYYQENIIAEIYALADWFTPADVEAPTIEGVHFYHRQTGKLIPFVEIPPVIFSEIMRDVDLVVSVAHVGGVDPEASLSTVEMRSVLVAEMIRLLKLTNVELKGAHAMIQGQLGEYTVHLGSGVVHKMAKGALHILPVHSQHRGRIFLPFVDEDPRTAEIISKVTMLAEDRKIKDPTILDQIAN